MKETKTSKEDDKKGARLPHNSIGSMSCWLSSCLKMISPQETRIACLTLIRTLSTCKSFQDALNDYSVLSEVVSVLRHEVPSSSINAMEIAATPHENSTYLGYMFSHSRELVDLSLRVLAAFAHFDWKGWLRTVRKENLLGVAADTALWEMAIQKAVKKTKDSSSSSNIDARILRYALIMIAHILSVSETQESAMRMIAEDANLGRKMARCARGASELRASELKKIGFFVMKCVERVSR